VVTGSVVVVTGVVACGCVGDGVSVLDGLPTTG